MAAEAGVAAFDLQAIGRIGADIYPHQVAVWLEKSLRL